MTGLDVPPGLSGSGWRRGVAAADESALAGLFARARRADCGGPGPADRPDPDADYLIARDPRGTAVALAWMTGNDPAELIVDPQFRRRGIGSNLAAAVLARGVGIWAHGSAPAAAGLAAKLGVVPVRELRQLRRDLNETWPVDMPAGTRIRSFLPGHDEAEFLAVNARAFAWHPEQGRLDLAGLFEAQAQPWFDPPGFLLAVDVDDRVLGFHWTKIHPVDPTPSGGEWGAIGEVYVLAVDPESPVRRLGAPLTAAGLEYLAGKGLRAVMLYVEADNEPAIKLYRRFGFELYQTDVVYARA